MAEELEACGSWRFRCGSPTPSNALSTLAGGSCEVKGNFKCTQNRSCHWLQPIECALKVEAVKEIEEQTIRWAVRL